MEDLSRLQQNALTAVVNVVDLAGLDQVRVHYLGKKGVLTEYLKGLGELTPQERPKSGQDVNNTKQALQNAIEMRRIALQEAALNTRLAQESLDITLPGRGQTTGGLHPITRSLQRIQELFVCAGFEVAEGPEIESDYFNFEALNIPANHPARAMHDTFYVDAHTVLRSHFSSANPSHAKSTTTVAHYCARACVPL